MIFKTNKMAEGIATNGTASEELRQKYWMEYEEKLQNFGSKRKYTLTAQKFEYKCEI